MKIGYVSDIHTEHWQDDTIDLLNRLFETVDYDVLVIAGDLCPLNDVNWLLESISNKINIPIIYTPGNHEFYGFDYAEYKKEVRGNKEKNIYWLDHGQHIVISDVVFYGIAGFVDGSWHDIHSGQNFYRFQLNDFRRIRNYDITKFDTLYGKDIVSEKFSLLKQHYAK